MLYEVITGGGSIGGTSNLLIYPDYKLVVAAVTNDTRSKVRRLNPAMPETRFQDRHP